jgi:hypothetical protein
MNKKMLNLKKKFKLTLVSLAPSKLVICGETRADLLTSDGSLVLLQQQRFLHISHF